ncbi:hypothetical protein [Actinocrispum sp. NPDC049592]|uniref:hypothetical protein n=1 Tax=Actinocrispum sp. NPDC049592 TaxID=3154835 RepID=UPI003438806C
MIHGDNLRTASQESFSLSPEQRYCAVRLVASVADDAADCLLLLEALGLDPVDGRSREDETDISIHDGGTAARTARWARPRQTRPGDSDGSFIW